jgi:hypothetical protein
MKTLLLAVAVTLTVVAAVAPGAAPTIHSKPRNGPLTLFGISGSTDLVSVVSVGGQPTTIWECPRHPVCEQPVSFAWAPDGRRVAFTLDEIGGNSTYPPGLHIVNVVSGRQSRIPGGAPRGATITDPPRGVHTARR